MRKAFLLGAGLGTRLRPMTETLPKPLIPFRNRPLITHVMDRCLQAGITDIAINTHHLPEAWPATFPDRTYRGATLTFFHEPELLETGGGIKNIASWIGEDPVLVYNGDIISDLPLDRLMTTHMAGNNLATLAVRDSGPQLHLTVKGPQVQDIGKGGTHQFTGVYCIDPEILSLIPENRKVSVIPAFRELISRQRLGAYHLKGDPLWLDLGTRSSYLEASFSAAPSDRDPLIHPKAQVADGAHPEDSWVGERAVIEPGAKLSGCLIWPGAHVMADAELTNCVVHTTSPVSGIHRDADL